MKSLSLALLATLIILSSIDTPSHAQNRRRSRPKSLITKRRSIEVIDFGSPEERTRIFEECAGRDRPKPEVEVGRNGNALLCGKAISKPAPPYPEAAKAEKISGTVAVNVVLDEKGRVIWAKAIDGHPSLQDAAVKAACQVLYSPIKISGRALKANGIITYNFIIKAP